MRGVSRAGQEEGKLQLSFLFVFSGASRGGLGIRFGRGTRGTGNTECLFVGPQDGHMARQRHPRGTGTGAQWSKGAERLRQGKKLCRPHREKGRGSKPRTSGPGEQESRSGADLGRPGSGNGPSAEGQSMRRGRKGARNDRAASIREGRQQACRRAMGTKKALAVSCKGEIWWAIRDSNPEPTD